MIQAHGLVGDANMKEAQAKSLRKLADSLNRSIPNYQNAAMQAAIHVMATFSGLQLAARDRPQGHDAAPSAADSATRRTPAWRSCALASRRSASERAGGRPRRQRR